MTAKSPKSTKEIQTNQVLTMSELLTQFDSLLTECMNASFDCGAHNGTREEYVEVKATYDVAKIRLSNWVRNHLE